MTAAEPSSAPSLSLWENKLSEAQTLAAEAARFEFAKDYGTSFPLYLRAGQIYLWLWRTHDAANSGKSISASQKELKVRLRSAAKKVLDRAEIIKKIRGNDVRPDEKRILSLAEQERALHFVTQIGQRPLPQWTSDPSPSLFQGSLYDDSEQPTLAPLHVREGAKYMRRLENVPWRDSILFDEKNQIQGRDIVQDVINDCSFVAALEVARAHDLQWNTNVRFKFIGRYDHLKPLLQLAHAPLYPKDANGTPMWSENGHHVVRLFMNGAWRSVSIDDRLPCDSKNGFPMCAVGLRSGTVDNVVLWPALLEKAYLSLRGGYDFRGSNSSIDAHALTGWIPEHVGFRHAGFQREKTWLRIEQAFRKGHVFVTAGTTKGAQKANGTCSVQLIDSHNYAILDIFQRNEERYMLMMNPWRRYARRNSQIRSETTDMFEEKATWTTDLSKALPDRDTMTHHESDWEKDRRLEFSMETFEMSWDEACVRLDALYLNWDPSIFTHQVTFHSIWSSPVGRVKGAEQMESAVQILLDVSPTNGANEAQVWLLLVRHFDAEQNTPQWISVHAFDGRDDGKQMLDQGRMGTFVDSTHTLTQYSARRGTSLLVASKQSDKDHQNQQKDVQHSFTLTAYSTAHLTFHEVPQKYPRSKVIDSQWTVRTSGGNAMHSSFVHNPQFLVSVPPDAAKDVGMRVVVETNRDLPVQVTAVWAPSTTPALGIGGRRVDNVSSGDIVCSSGAYTYGLAIAEEAALIPGATLVLIVSSYNPGQSGDFTLTVQSQNIALAESVHNIPGEGAGMHHRRLRSAWSIAEGSACGAPRHHRYHDNPRFLLTVARKTTIHVRLSVTSKAPNSAKAKIQTAQGSPHINVAIFAKRSEDENIGAEIVSSGPYADNVCGVTIKPAILEAGEYIVIPSTFDSQVEAEFLLDVYGDKPITFSKLGGLY